MYYNKKNNNNRSRKRTRPRPHPRQRTNKHLVPALAAAVLLIVALAVLVTYQKASQIAMGRVVEKIELEHQGVSYVRLSLPLAKDRVVRGRVGELPPMSAWVAAQTGKPMCNEGHSIATVSTLDTFPFFAQASIWAKTAIGVAGQILPISTAGAGLSHDISMAMLVAGLLFLLLSAWIARVVATATLGFVATLVLWSAYLLIAHVADNPILYENTMFHWAIALSGGLLGVTIAWKRSFMGYVLQRATIAILAVWIGSPIVNAALPHIPPPAVNLSLVILSLGSPIVATWVIGFSLLTLGFNINGENLATIMLFSWGGLVCMLCFYCWSSPQKQGLRNSMLKGVKRHSDNKKTVTTSHDETPEFNHPAELLLVHY